MRKEENIYLFKVKIAAELLNIPLDILHNFLDSHFSTDKQENTYKIKDYLTIGAAAKFLGVSPNTLRIWGKEKKIMVYINPINKYHLYKKEDLIIFLQAMGKGNGIR